LEDIMKKWIKEQTDFPSGRKIEPKPGRLEQRKTKPSKSKDESNKNDKDETIEITEQK
jgi:hypothetical protein